MQHTVKIGKIEHKAHPFTVRISNLAQETGEMDLVENFRPKCGAIVHARIMREKNIRHKGESKGWGLVQFEERESVEKALALSDVIGIREKLVQVDRSHVPAVGLVPPGMHRPAPKAHGKPKKNKHHAKKDPPSTETASSSAQGDPKEASSETGKGTGGGTGAAPSSGMGILAFRPRGVGKHGHNHRKVKLSLSETKKE